MKLGTFVRLYVPDDRKAECFARGRVVAVEQYNDFHGTRTWLYVQWFDHNGKPDREPIKHAAFELEHALEQQL